MSSCPTFCSATAAASPDAHDDVPPESTAVHMEESADAVPLESIELDLAGIAKMAAVSNGHGADMQQFHAVRDELLACFHQWTQSQADALERLSEVHQNQIDQACEKIIHELSRQNITSPISPSSDEPFSSWFREPDRKPICAAKITDGRQISNGSAAEDQAERCSQLKKTLVHSKSNSVISQTSVLPRVSETLRKSRMSRPAKSRFKSGVFEQVLSSESRQSRSPQSKNKTKLSMVGTKGNVLGYHRANAIALPKESFFKEGWWEHVLPRSSINAWTEPDRKPNQFELIVTSKAFDIFSALLIVAFLATLGIETNYMSQHSGSSNSGLSILSLVFNIVFTAELVLRIAAERARFIYSDEWALNLVDVLLVVNSIVEMIVALLANRQPKGQGSRVGRVMRIVRILRVIRIVRLVRALRYFYQFRKMVCLIQGCFLTLFWCLLILLGIVYTFAIFFTQGAIDHLFQSGLPQQEVPSGAAIHQYYGSLALSMHSLFLSMSNGISWGLTFRPLEDMGWVYSMCFLFFLTSSVFGVLNVITSVFVESTMKSAMAYRDLIITDNERTKGVALEHLRDVFKEIDEDGNGILTIEEMMQFLNDPSIHMYMEALDINLHDARTLFVLLDTDQSGLVDIDEFCDGCLKLKGEAKAFDVHCLMCEVAKFFKRWSNFTEYTVKRFNTMEEFMQKQTRDVRPGRDEFIQKQTSEVRPGKLSL